MTRPVGDVIHSGASVALEVGAKKAQLGHLWNQFFGESFVSEIALYGRENFALDELAHRVANHPLLVAEHLIKVKKVQIF